jgi:hypothetical protein
MTEVTVPRGLPAVDPPAALRGRPSGTRSEHNSDNARLGNLPLDAPQEGDGHIVSESNGELPAHPAPITFLANTISVMRSTRSQSTWLKGAFSFRDGHNVSLVTSRSAARHECRRSLVRFGRCSFV